MSKENSNRVHRAHVVRDPRKSRMETELAFSVSLSDLNRIAEEKWPALRRNQIEVVAGGRGVILRRCYLGEGNTSLPELG